MRFKEISVREKFNKFGDFQHKPDHGKNRGQLLPLETLPVKEKSLDILINKPTTPTQKHITAGNL